MNSYKIIFFFFLIHLLSVNCFEKKDNNLNEDDEETMIEEELNLNDLRKDVKIEILKKPDNCVNKAKANDFLIFHYQSRWLASGEIISSTYERGVPIEIQLGTKVLFPGVDFGLDGICVGEKRKLTLPAKIGLSQSDFNEKNQDELVEYEVELFEIHNKITISTFNYLDLNNDGKISVDEAESLIKAFLSPVSSLLPNLDMKQLLSFFISMYDKDGDNKISKNEFLDAINTFPMKDEL